MRFITKKTIAFALLAVFIGGLVLPVAHILETDAKGHHCHATDCNGKENNSHSKDSCSICRHVLFTNKSAQIQTTLGLLVTFAGDCIVPVYNQPVIRLFITTNNPLRAPPCLSL